MQYCRYNFTNDTICLEDVEGQVEKGEVMEEGQVAEVEEEGC